MHAWDHAARVFITVCMLLSVAVVLWALVAWVFDYE